MPNTKYQKDERPQTKGSDAWAKKELFLFEPKTLLVIIISSVLTLLVVFFGEKGAKYLTSVISTVPEHAPYDGAGFPIRQVPNWVKLSNEERNASYTQIPQDTFTGLPSYNPARLALPTSSLRWNNSEDDAVRNEKITYSTPYLGSYRLDGIEGSGSHPAVDIKVPEGTPVHAMSNGTVVKAQYSSGGFGNHVVLQHNDFPSYEDANKKVRLFSSYSHLSSISVSENQVVTRGDIIGLSGSSGTATTPHLHFQIDVDEAGWHPYWPFSGADMRSAGYSFFEAINNGLGQGNAATYTLNPMRYVQKYYGQQTLVASSTPTVTRAPIEEDRFSSAVFIVQILGGSRFEAGSDIDFMIQAFDAEGNLLTAPDFPDLVSLSMINNIGRLNRKSLSSAQFQTGIANTVKVLNTRAGKDTLIVRFRDKEFSSKEFEVFEKKPELGGFFIEVEKKSLLPGDTLNVRLRAVDPNAKYIASFDFQEIPTITLTNPIGTLSRDRIESSDISNGEANITFTANRPGDTEILVGYKSIILRSGLIVIMEPPAAALVPVPSSESVPLTSVISTDVPAAPAPAPAPFPAPALTESVPPSAPAPTPTPPDTPASEPIPAPPAPPVEPVVVAPPETAPPQIEVPTLPEAPPALITSTAIDVGQPRLFSDVPPSSRYQEALNDLKAAGVVAGYSDGTFKLEQNVSRAEAITFILKAIDEKVRDNVTAIFPDVSGEAWYINFVATAFDLGFVKGYPDGTFKPESNVTLAEFFTMFFVGAKTDVDPQIILSLPPGIAPTDWYAPYLQEALRKGLLDLSSGTIDPAKPLTRGDIVEILYKIRRIEGS